MSISDPDSDSGFEGGARRETFRHYAFLVGIGLVVAAFDQFSKALVTANLALGETWTPIPAIGGYFAITRSANSGAAFSIFQGNNTPLLLLSLAMVGVILVAYRNTARAHILQKLAMGVLLGGVLGNTIDRLTRGTVVDFIHWQIPGIISNVSNLADHAIVFSIIVLFLTSLRAAPDPAISVSADNA